MRSLLRRIARSVEKNGFWTAAGHGFTRVRKVLAQHGIGGVVQRLVKPAPAQSAVSPQSLLTHPFDVAHGTDTGGYISGGALSLQSRSAFYTTAYYAATPSTFSSALAELPLDPSEYTFGDIGCGKGRALILAARLPWRGLFGVELDPDLAGTATLNCTRLGLGDRVQIRAEDATTTTYPEGPLLLFFYHPFMASVLHKVLLNLQKQLRRTPRETWILYALDPTTSSLEKDEPLLLPVAQYRFPLSAEDAAVDHFRRSEETFALFRCAP